MLRYDITSSQVRRGISVYECTNCSPEISLQHASTCYLKVMYGVSD